MYSVCVFFHSWSGLLPFSTDFGCISFSAAFYVGVKIALHGSSFCNALIMGDYPTCKELARFSPCYFKSIFRHNLVRDLMRCCIRSQSTRACEFHKHPGFKNFLETLSWRFL
jgi:hypothetical protein